MKKLMFVVVVVLLCGAFAAPALAQEAGGGSSHLGLAILGLGVAAGGAGLGQGLAASGAVSGMARNPGAGGDIRTTLLLALAFMESLVIFTFVMVFLTRGGG